MACAVVALVGVGIGASPVHAHAELVRSQPANGEQVAALPAALVMTYSEGVQRGAIAVVDSEGRRVDRGEVSTGPADRSSVEVPLQAAGGTGIYTARWEVLSEDGHTTKGSIFFLVGEGLPSRERFLQLLSQSAESGGEVSLLEPPIRWLLFVCLVLLVGVPIVLLLVVRPALSSTGILEGELWNSVRLLLLATSVLFVCSATLLGANQMTAAYPSITPDTGWSFATTTSLGLAWIVRLLLGAGLLLVLLFLPSRTVATLAAFVAGIAAQASLSWTSHTATLLRSNSSTLADFGHLLGGALWAGGLVVLAVLLPSVVRGQDGERAVLFTAKVIRKFSTLAIFGVCLAVATGLLLASFHVPSWSALVTTLYGSSLTVKVGLALAAITLGALHRLVMLPRLTRASVSGSAAADYRSQVGRFVRSVRLELVFVLGVLIFSGLLTSARTATSAVAQRESRRPFTLVERMGDVDVLLTITPYQVGLNVFDVSMSRSGERVQDAKDASIIVRLPERDVELPRFQLEPTDPGMFSTLGSLTLPGVWQVRVSANVGGRFTAKRFDVPLRPTQEGQEADSGVTEVYVSGIVDESFKRLLTLGAMVIGVVGSVALAYELHEQRVSRCDETTHRETWTPMA